MCDIKKKEFSKCLAIKHINQSKKQFWQMIDIYISNIHVVNRKIFGIVNESIFSFRVEKKDFNLDNNFKQLNYNIKDSLISSLEKLQLAKEISDLNQSSFEKLKLHLKNYGEDNLNDNLKYVLLQKLLPRKTDQHVFILTYINLEDSCVTFLPGNTEPNDNIIPNLPYQISLQGNNLRIDSPEEEGSKSSIWLTSVLFPKLIKWIEAEKTPNDPLIIKSLSAINIEKYSILYNELKKKYGLELVKIWPEKTNPSKYVYEDIAIATYLILIWEEERLKLDLNKKQSFVDIGCGNGLLVYILSSEGYDGLGIDLRKRGIWDFYPITTKLRVEAIKPSDKSVFPLIDWILGNHSDELSPWIPVMAARSSYNARYFLLPCCAFEFDGTKYKRTNGNKSQYNDFLDYVELISNECGFETIIDRLKIPSTKRVCLIGMKRTYCETEFDNYSIKIQKFIDSRIGCNNKITEEKTELWSQNFIPRDSVEKVRNCTQIDKNIINEIVQIVFNTLILTKRYLNEYGNWNVGGCITLPEIAKLISSEKLKKLKSEFGGLQTLIRNNHEIFQVINGVVQIRLPIKLSDKILKNKDKNILYKKKNCWFLNNHPDKCFFDDKDCSFKH